MNPTKTLLLVLVTILTAALAMGQTITGSIAGTITDPAGAVVPNAKVTATNTQTGVTFDTTSNDAGVYRLLFLPVGSYTVTVETQGFKRFSQGPFPLEVNQIARVDVRMELGETTQTVEVTGEAPILQTESRS
jgi:hypothetical protein